MELLMSRTRRALSRLAILAGAAALLTGIASAQIISAPDPAPPPAPVQPNRPTTPATPASGCYDVLVTVVADHPEGGAWDPWSGRRALPDPEITEATTGLVNACTDSMTCSLRLPRASGTLRFTILDLDPDAPDPIGSANCKAGQSCKAGRASISMSRC